MKTLLAFFLFILHCQLGVAQVNNQDTTLLVVGTFNLKNNLVRDIEVKLYVKNQLVDSIIVEGNQAFGFYLKRNLVYSMDVYKEGFIKKTIGISTKLPDDIKTKPFFTFPFQVPLDRAAYEDKYVKYSSDFPTAVIYFNEEQGQFDYGIDSSRIKRKADKGKKTAQTNK